MTPLSLRGRLALWYSVVLLALLGVFGATLLWQQNRTGLRRVDRELVSLETTLVNVLQEESSESNDLDAVAREVCDIVADPGHAVALLDGRGRVIAASWNGLDPGDTSWLAQPPASAWTLDTPGGSWRAHLQRQTVDGAPIVLLVASPLADLARDQADLRQAMLLGMVLVVVLAGGGGMWLASIGLRPITAMAARAAHIPPSGMEDLGDDGRTDELGQLAAAFNGLVSRLRAALQTQRRFMADASHELRTPVSVTRTAAEVTLSREHRSEPEYREALAIVGGEARRLSRLVEDMLVLARADGGGYTLRLTDLYIDELATDCRRAADVLAREHGIAIEVTGGRDVMVQGDEDLLRRLILNLLLNAVQHTPDGGRVTVETCQREDAVAVRVGDSGPGIPESERERIFDRFVQLDTARRGGGSGLGLAIARWIATAHHGSLSLESSGPAGSVFCLSLPLSATPQ